PDAAAFRRLLAAGVEPLHPRDAARLAAEIGQTGDVLETIHTTTARVVRFLEGHPKVAHVYWALQKDSRENFNRVARGSNATGGMISFSLRTPMEPFYNAL